MTETITHDITDRPGLTESTLLDLLSASTLGVLATLKRDGRPQLSNVGYHWNGQTNTARIIAAGFRAKTVNLRRDPRGSLHVTNARFNLWLVAEGVAEISEPCRSNDDAIADEIFSLPGYDRLVRDAPETRAHLEDYPIIGRHILRLHVDRIYGGEASAALGIAFTPEGGVS